MPPFEEVEDDKVIVPEFAPSPPKLSFDNTLIELLIESSSTVTASETLVGVSFTEETLTVTVAVEVSPSASLIV